MPRLTLLLPSVDAFAGVALPAPLAAALGRADRTRAAPGEAAQLARHVRAVPAGLAAAALTRLVDSGEDDARQAAWLRADPAYARPDINGVRVLGIGASVGIDRADVEALLPALRPLFGDAGMPLDAPAPHRWYLCLARGSRLPAFAAPHEALGDDLFEHAPEGPEARRWRVLASEAQVVLHNHPHNAARIAAGKLPVNSLWFWGGGVLPDVMSVDATTVFSDDAEWQAIARLATLPCMTPSDLAAVDPVEDALVDLRRHAPHALVEGWLSPALARGRLELDFADGSLVSLRPSQRWRLWRRPQASLVT